MADKQRKVEWFWREGFPAYGDAGKIGEELARMAEKLGLPFNGLTGEQVTEAARSKRQYPELNRVIHSKTDEDAALRWRINRANRVISFLGYRVIDEGEQPIHIGRVSIEHEDEGRMYVPVPEVVRIQAYRAQMLEDAARYIESFQARFAELEGATDDPELREAFRLIGIAAKKFRKAADGEQPQTAAV